MTDETAEYYGDEALDLTEDMEETWEIKIRGKEGEKKKKSRILRIFIFGGLQRNGVRRDGHVLREVVSPIYRGGNNRAACAWIKLKP